MSRCLAVRAVQDEGIIVAAAATPHHPAVPPGQVLVAVVDNGTWQQARDVTHATAYDALYRRLAEGVWRNMRLYLIDAERAAELEDGRRTLMDGRPVRDPGR